MNNTETQNVAQEEGFSVSEWEICTPEEFNLAKEYEEQVLPLIEAVMDKCKQLGIPIIVFAQTANDIGTENNARSEYLSHKERIGINLMTVSNMLDRLRGGGIPQLTLSAVTLQRSAFNRICHLRDLIDG